MTKKIYIAAGGTAGHINAALSLGEILSKDYHVTYVSGERHLDFKLFENQDCLHIKSKPLRSRGPKQVLKNLLINIKVFIELVNKFRKEKPEFVIGAGGYVCGPTLMACKILKKPIFIIEQNSVLGLTNSILSRFASIVFTSFKETKGIKNPDKAKFVGNPIKPSIKFSENKIGEKIKILVFGGSLGATQINRCLINLLGSKLDLNLEIFHQVGKDNSFEIENKNPSINYTQVEYIDDMNEKYEWANIILARAGASTISELRVIKKPAILIPLQAKDHHQYFNALNLQEENLSYIEVLDHTLPASMLANRLKLALEKIVKEKLYYIKESENVNVGQIIVDEIINHVRNK